MRSNFVAPLLTLTLTAVSAPVSAHRFEHPRQLRVGVTPERLVVSMLYDLNPGEPSRTARQLFDRNTDGQIDDGERELLEAWMERTALRAFSVSLGVAERAPEPLALERVRREGHRTNLPSSASESMGISLLFTAALPKAHSKLSIELRDQEIDASKHVPLILDLAPGLSLRYASQGEWHPSTRQLHRVALTKAQSLRLQIDVGGAP